jgi:hypothetical protein
MICVRQLSNILKAYNLPYSWTWACSPLICVLFLLACLSSEEHTYAISHDRFACCDPLLTGRVPALLPFARFAAALTSW